MIYYSNAQYKAIKDFFDSNRKISVSEAVAPLFCNTRKPYYVARNALTTPEEIIRMAILSKIEPSLITNQLFKLTNYSLADNNARNTIILDGINKHLSLETINMQLIEAHEYPF